MKNYAVNVIVTSKEFIALPLGYDSSKLLDGKLMAEGVCIPDDEDDKKISVLIKVDNVSNETVFALAENMGKAKESVLKMPLKSLDANSLSNLDCHGLLGEYGSITSLDRLHPTFRKSLNEVITDYLSKNPYDHYVIDNHDKTHKDVKSSSSKKITCKEMSKKPTVKLGLTYDIIQEGTISQRRVYDFSYIGAKKTEGTQGIILTGLKSITSEEKKKIKANIKELEDYLDNYVDGVTAEKPPAVESRRVLCSTVDTEMNLLSKKGVLDLSQVDKLSEEVGFDVVLLETSKGKSEPSILSSSTLLDVKHLISNSNHYQVELSAVNREFMVAKAIKEISKDRELAI